MQVTGETAEYDAMTPRCRPCRDFSKIVADVVALGADGKKVGVISTINGDANIGFYKELAAVGVSADDIPVVAFSVGEEELRGIDTSEHRLF